METTTVIEKIKKLLSLSTSPNANEAAAALAKAHALMAKHNVEVTSTEEKLVIVRESLTFDTIKVSRYPALLANALASHFMCYSFTKGNSLLFVGTELATTSLKSCFTYSYNVFLKLSKQYMDTYGSNRQHKNELKFSYFQGFVRGLTNELIRSENENALVVTTPQELDDYINKLHIITVKRVTYMNHNVKASARGYEDGSFAIRSRDTALSSTAS